MPVPDLTHAIGLPPEKAIAYLESKGYAIGFKWQDVWAEAHARAFTVAGVMKTDVLQDVRNALTEQLQNGGTLADFQNRLQPTLEAKGWWGKGRIVDEATGEVTGKRLNPRRLETIFRTNMQSAYMAGRYQEQLANAEDRPWWEYVAVLDTRTRPAHRAMSGRVFRYDDPFWQTFYPPNGWRCRCRVRARSGRDIERNNIQTSSSTGQLETIEQPVGRKGEARPATAYRDPATGERFVTDAGFGFNPGRAALKPFTPPPLDDLPRTFPKGVELSDLPKPTTVPASRLLAKGLQPQEYAAAFLDRFGLQLGESKVFRDVAGDSLAISDDLFKTAAGDWKADKAGRGPYMSLLADAVQEPDEIWLRWEESRDQPGKWLLKRRYIKSWEIDGQNGAQYGLSVFEFGQDGWSASTAMMANPDRGTEARRRYIEQQRDGFLRYQK